MFGWVQLLLIVKRRIKKGRERGWAVVARGSSARSNNKNSWAFVFRRRGRNETVQGDEAARERGEGGRGGGGENEGEGGEGGEGRKEKEKKESEEE